VFDMRMTRTTALRCGAGAFAAIAGASAWLCVIVSSGREAPGQAAYERGRYFEAFNQASARLRDHPEDRRALRLVARSGARIGDVERSQALYGRLGERAMEAEDFFLLGSGLIRLGKLAQATVVLERGRALDPTHAETLHELARLYARRDRMRDAIDAADRLADRPGWQSRGALIAGVLRWEAADAPGAAASLERAIWADPGLVGGIARPAPARKLLARAWLQSGQPDRALDPLRAVLGSGADPEAHWLTSRAYLQTGDAPRASEALARAGDFGRDDATRPEPAPYVGAAACARCHAAKYRDEQGSRHSRTFSTVEGLGGLALPEAPVHDPALPDTTHALRREGGAIRLVTRSGDRDLTALVEFALGSGDRGLTMVARDDDGTARVCRVSAYRDRTLWDLTSHAAPPHPDDPRGTLGRPMSADAVAVCVGCHVTSPRAARDRRAPEAADRGIGCERCHGPGGNHLAAIALKFPDAAIARLPRATAGQITRLCGACHKSDDPSIPDSDPRSVRFQATTLPRSRCYTESLGALSCTTCHDPHRDAEKAAAPYESKCLSCHAAGTPGIESKPRESLIAQEMRHVACPVNPATDCLKCHMPKVDGAAPHSSFTDHQIRIRRTVAPDDRPAGAVERHSPTSDP
jgi:tetratricopeptide (TPR) repeat protein